MAKMKYFKENEFLMGGVEVFDKMDPIFLQKLDDLREKINSPMVITSSFRTEAYNKKIKGAKLSMHLYGRAVDISCQNSHYRALVLKEALNMGLSVGVGSNFLHLDDRANQLVFTYYK